MFVNKEIPKFVALEIKKYNRSQLLCILKYFDISSNYSDSKTTKYFAEVIIHMTHYLNANHIPYRFRSRKLLFFLMKINPLIDFQFLTENKNDLEEIKQFIKTNKELSDDLFNYCSVKDSIVYYLQRDDLDNFSKLARIYRYDTKISDIMDRIVSPFYGEQFYLNILFSLSALFGASRCFHKMFDDGATVNGNVLVNIFSGGNYGMVLTLYNETDIDISEYMEYAIINY